MASRKEELKKAKAEGEAIVEGAKTRKRDAVNWLKEKTPLANLAEDYDMLSGSYNEAKAKYGVGPGDKRDVIYNDYYYKDTKPETRVGGDDKRAFMPEEEFNKRKEELNKPKTSLVADKFGEKKSKTWNDVKTENENDPTKMAEWLNNNPDYKAGELTKKGMSEFGYSQGEDGKWTTAPTNDDVIDGIETITEDKKDGPKFKTVVDSLVNPETGDVDKEKAKSVISEYEQKLVESGAAYYDKNGKFTFKPANSKGWETWATMLSVGLSAVGLAIGIPIIPINFRAITGKDAKDAQVRALQQQYLNIMADDAANVKGMKADVEAGKIAQGNQDALAAQEKHKQATAATKDVIGAQTSAEKELIETRTDAEIRKDEAQFKRDMSRLKSDRDFQLKFAALQQQYGKEMAQLQSDLSTGSAIDLMKYQNSGFLKDMKNMGISPSELASYTAAKSGISPADKNWNRVKTVGDTLGSVLSFIPGI